MCRKRLSWKRRGRGRAHRSNIRCDGVNVDSEWRLEVRGAERAIHDEVHGHVAVQVEREVLQLALLLVVDTVMVVVVAVVSAAVRARQDEDGESHVPGGGATVAV